MADKFDLATAQELHGRKGRDELLNSMTSGLVILRSAQLKNEARAYGRAFAADMARRLTERHDGVASVGLYEEVFGKQDRLNWIIHVRQLSDYNRIISGYADPACVEALDALKTPGGGNWADMFVDGSFNERAIVPHSPGGFGTQGVAN